MKSTFDGLDALLVCAAVFYAGWLFGEKVHAKRVDLHPSGEHRVTFHGEDLPVYLCTPATQGESDGED